MALCEIKGSLSEMTQVDMPRHRISHSIRDKTATETNQTTNPSRIPISEAKVRFASRYLERTFVGTAEWPASGSPEAQVA